MEVHPGVTELWDVVGVVIGVLVLQGRGDPGMLELVSSHEKISLFRASLSLISLVDIRLKILISKVCVLVLESKNSLNLKVKLIHRCWYPWHEGKLSGIISIKNNSQMDGT